MNKGITNYLLVVLCAFSFISCGALFKGSTQTIGVKSFQEGSTIVVDKANNLVLWTYLLKSFNQ